MTDLAFAEKIGTEFDRKGYTYCEDDNTHTPYLYTVTAWACPIDAYTPAAPTAALTADEMMALLFPAD